MRKSPNHTSNNDNIFFSAKNRAFDKMEEYKEQTVKNIKSKTILEIAKIFVKFSDIVEDKSDIDQKAKDCIEELNNRDLDKDCAPYIKIVEENIDKLHKSYDITDINNKLALNNEKWGFATSGGALNVYTYSGFMFALRQLGINIDSIMGSSAGAWIILPHIYSGDIVNSTKCVFKCSYHDQFNLSHLLDGKHPGNHFVERRYLSLLDHIDMDYASKVDTNFFINITGPKGNSIIKSRKDLTTPHLLAKYVMASCSHPLLSGVYFKDKENSFMLDGVLSDDSNIKNIEHLQSQGIEKIVTFTTSEKQKKALKAQFPNLYIIDGESSLPKKYRMNLEDAMLNFANTGPKLLHQEMPGLIEFLTSKPKTQ